MKHPIFIALEGIDGSGKSTQAIILAQKLEAAGHRVYTTFEPTDSVIGSIIRNILKGNMKADEHTIAALFAADRLHHLTNETDGILKKLSEGFHVITDRFYFSSYAYHGVHVPMDWVIQSNAMSAKIRRPDVNIFIDVSPQTSMNRVQNRNATELYETLDNLTKVRENYLAAFEQMKQEEKVVSIDGNRPLAQISRDIWEYVSEMLKHS